MKRMSDQNDALWEKIAGKLHGELTVDEEKEFNELISNPSHLHEFEKAQKIHEQLKKTSQITSGQKDNSWLKINKQLKYNQLRWIGVALKYAAIVTIAFLVGNLIRPNPKTASEIRYSEITVPFGQMSQLKLSDGTQIWLNSGTTLRYPDRFSDSSRTVTIAGEAFFKVSKMKDKPFIVKTLQLNVQVLGTSFNLSAYQEDNTTAITLVEGKVAIQDTEGKTIRNLNPGQLAIKNRNSNNLDIKLVETDFYSAWTEGKIFFDDEELDQIAVKLERWFNVEITFADEKLKSHRFTGTILKNKPVDQIMQVLELLAPIHFKHQVNPNGKDKITIYGR
jgi:ferric-dicitrate binding protein FerR (iron transport regulator)